MGPWCFVDLILPPDFDEPHPLEVGPHPHTGLSTVTWLLEGEALHTDSLGSEQAIRPGQLNLMSAGNGIAHAELGTTEGIHGVQMWLAQPEETRHGSSRFEHIPDLPVADFPAAEVKVMIGELDGNRSPAEVDWATVGLDVTLHGRRIEIPADAGFEYAVIPINHKLKVEDAIVEPGWLALVPPGAETLPIEGAGAETRFLVLGGEPLGEPIEMWWNFVARTQGGDHPCLEGVAGPRPRPLRPGFLQAVSNRRAPTSLAPDGLTGRSDRWVSPGSNWRLSRARQLTIYSALMSGCSSSGSTRGLWTAATNTHFCHPSNRFYPALRRGWPNRLVDRHIYGDEPGGEGAIGAEGDRDHKSRPQSDGSGVGVGPNRAA